MKIYILKELAIRFSLLKSIFHHKQELSSYKLISKKIFLPTSCITELMIFDVFNGKKDCHYCA